MPLNNFHGHHKLKSTNESHDDKVILDMAIT